MHGGLTGTAMHCMVLSMCMFYRLPEKKNLNGIETLAQIIRNKRALHLVQKNRENAKSERKGKMAVWDWTGLKCGMIWDLPCKALY